ncbi:unnamed protein product [Spirodela intermedia]|uniref:Uncharacterized protein n=1 Tax=Spirodela intermedia TaxID=51605 RepID=A0A7I8J2J1_SPIIN|nr:unnamed protein product [Spirodela intermedia]CAA6663601.1 unnamed protein product [Spirodela intermedia]
MAKLESKERQGAAVGGGRRGRGKAKPRSRRRRLRHLHLPDREPLLPFFRYPRNCLSTASNRPASTRRTAKAINLRSLGFNLHTVCLSPLGVGRGNVSSPTGPPPHAETTTCGAMLKELQNLWDEIGESDTERDKMILQLEQECLDIYRRKVDQARKQKTDLCQTLAEAEAEVSRLIQSLGEHESFSRLEKPKGTLKEQVAVIMPAALELRSKRDARLTQFLDVQSHIFQIHGELTGTLIGKFSSHLLDEEDLSQRRLGELKSKLQELQKEKNRRLGEVNNYIKMIHETSNVMSVDFNKTIREVHPSFLDIRSDQSKSISNDTLARLDGSIHFLMNEKKQRLQKLQDMGGTLIELWHLMETPLEEQKKFEFVTRLLSLSVDEVLDKGCLSMGVIEQTQMEVDKLNALKSRKMKELILKKQLELEAIYKGVHIDANGEEARQALIDVIESGKLDLSELLLGMDDQIKKAIEQALSRKEILDKVQKWIFASEEELWLDDYERSDQNRYNAGRGAHKNLKRAEKARKLVGKIPSIVESLMGKIKVWEKERACLFLYDKERLLDTLEEYALMRHQREEDKRRSREEKKLQEQLVAEQEMLFGSKPSPMRPFLGKKPLGRALTSTWPPGRRWAAASRRRWAATAAPLLRQGEKAERRRQIGRGRDPRELRRAPQG